MITQERIRELATEMTPADVAKLIAHVCLNEHQAMQKDMAQDGDFKAKQILGDRACLADGANRQARDDIFRSTMFQRLVTIEIDACAEEYVRN